MYSRLHAVLHRPVIEAGKNASQQQSRKLGLWKNTDVPQLTASSDSIRFLNSEDACSSRRMSWLPIVLAAREAEILVAGLGYAGQTARLEHKGGLKIECEDAIFALESEFCSVSEINVTSRCTTEQLKHITQEIASSDSETGTPSKSVSSTSASDYRGEVSDDGGDFVVVNRSKAAGQRGNPALEKTTKSHHPRLTTGNRSNFVADHRKTLIMPRDSTKAETSPVEAKSVNRVEVQTRTKNVMAAAIAAGIIPPPLNSVAQSVHVSLLNPAAASWVPGEIVTSEKRGETPQNAAVSAGIRNCLFSKLDAALVQGCECGVCLDYHDAVKLAVDYAAFR